MIALYFLLGSAVAAYRLDDNALGLNNNAFELNNNGYQANKEYIYLYDVQVASGLPGLSNIFAVTKIKTDVRIQFKTETEAIMMLSNTMFFKVNDKVEFEEPDTMKVPDVFLQLAVGKNLEHITIFLETPIKFKYIKGKVSSIEVETDDPHWSVNTKLGVLSLLEITLDKSQALDVAMPTIFETTPKEKPIDVYSVMESSVVGKCENIYKVDNTMKPVRHVTKVRNYKNCLDRATLFFDMTEARKCEDCYSDMTDPLHSTSEVRYKLHGTTEKPFIYSAICENRHILTPFIDDGENYVTFGNQTLWFSRSESINNPIREPTHPRPLPTGLLAVLPQEFRPHLSVINPAEWQEAMWMEEPNREMPRISPEKKDEIMKVFTIYSETVKDKLHEDTTVFGRALVELLKMCTLTELKDIESEVEAKQPGKVSEIGIRDVFYDMLPAIRTRAAVQVIVEAIISGKVPAKRISPMVVQCAISAPADPFFVELILRLTTDPKVMSDVKAKRAVYLSLGMIFHKVEKTLIKAKMHIKELTTRATISSQVLSTAINEKLAKTKPIFEKAKAKYEKLKVTIVQALTKLLDSTTSEDDVIIALKTIGNAGIPEIITKLETVIMNSSRSTILRTQAIFALRHNIYIKRAEIIELLSPIILNQAENDFVRIAAFTILIDAKPNVAVLQLIAHSMKMDASNQVPYYILTHLSSLANITNPCWGTLAKNATLARHFVKDVTRGASRFFTFESYCDLVKSGIRADVTVVSAKDSFVPQAMSAKLKVQGFGRMINVAEIGMNTEGVQALLDKLMGPKGVLSEKSVFDILKPRAKRDINMENIRSKLGVVFRESVFPSGHIYMKLFQYELPYLPLDEAIMSTFLNKGKVEMPYTEDELKEGIPIKMQKSIYMAPVAHHMIPMECGVLLNTKFDTTLVMNFDGSITTSGMPALFEKNRKGEMPKTVKFVIKGTPSIVTHLTASMTAEFCILKMGVSSKGVGRISLPIKMTAIIHPSKGKIITRFDIPKVPTKFATHSWTPYTFFKQIFIPGMPLMMLPSIREISVLKPYLSKKINWNVEPLWLGVDLNVTGSYSMGHNSKTCMNPVALRKGRHDVSVHIRPRENAPRTVEVQAQIVWSGKKIHKEEKKSKSLMSWITLGYWSDSAAITTATSETIGSSDDRIYSIKKGDIGMDTIIKDTKAPSLPGEEKAGLFVVVKATGDKTTRNLQLQVSMQRTPEQKSSRIDIKVVRSPIPGVETQPWKMKMSAKFDYPEPIRQPEEILSRQYRESILNVLVKKMTRPEEKDWIPAFKEILWKDHTTDFRSLMSFATEGSIGAWPYELLDYTNPEAMVTPPSWYTKYTEIRRRQSVISFECSKMFQMVPDPFTIAIYEPKIRKFIAEVKDIQESLRKILEEHRSVEVTESTISTHITYHIKLQAILLEHQRMVYLLCKGGMAMLNDDRQNIMKELLSGVNKNVLILTEEAKKTANLERYKLLTKLPKDDQDIYTTLLDKQIILLETMKKVTELTMAPEDLSRYMSVEKIMETIKTCESAVLEVLTTYKYTERVTTIKVQDVLLNMQLTIAHIKFFILQPIRITVNRNMVTRDEGTKFINNLPESLRSVQVLAWKVQVSLQIARYIQEQKNVKYPAPEVQTVYDKLHEVMVKQIMVDQEVEGLTLFTYPETLKPDIIPTLLKNVETIKKCQEEIETIVSTVRKEDVPRLWMKIEEVVNYHIRILRTTKMLVPVIFVTVQEPEMMKSYKEMLNMLEQLTETAHRLKIVPRPGREIRLPHPIRTEPTELPQPRPIAPTHPDITPSIERIVDLQKQITSRLRDLSEQVPKKLSVATAESSITQVLSDIGKTQQDLDSIFSVFSTIKDTPAYRSIAEKIKEIMEKHKDHIREAKTLVDTLLKEKVIPAMSPIVAKIADIQAQIEPLKVKLGNIIPEMMNRIPFTQQRDSPRSDNYNSNPSTHALSVDGEIHCEFGTHGVPPKTITIKIMARKSAEQLLWELRQGYTLSRDKVFHDYLFFNMTGRDKLNPSLPRMLTEVNSLREIQAEIMTSNLPTPVKRFGSFVHDFVKYVTFWNTEHTELFTRPGPDKTTVIAQLRRDISVADLIIKTPYEVNVVRDFYIPPWVQSTYVLPISVMRPYMDKITYAISSGQYPAKCTVEESTIVTMDRRTIPLPRFGDCETLMVMDCSPQETFAITIFSTTPTTPLSGVSTMFSTTPPTTPLSRSVKVIAEGCKVVMMKKENQFVVMFNGKTFEVKDTPILIPKPTGGEPVMRVSLIDNHAVLEATNLGFSVRTNGRGIQFEPSTLMRSKLCGVCGNYDGEHRNDLEGPRQNQYKSTDRFVASYLMSTNLCDAEKYRNEYGTTTPDTRNSFECVLVERNVVVRRTFNSNREVCVSLLPVKKCDNSCRSTSTTKQHVDFHCVREEDPIAKKALLVVNVHPMQEAASLPPSMKHDVYSANGCTRS